MDSIDVGAPGLGHEPEASAHACARAAGASDFGHDARQRANPDWHCDSGRHGHDNIDPLAVAQRYGHTAADRHNNLDPAAHTDRHDDPDPVAHADRYCHGDGNAEPAAHSDRGRHGDGLAISCAQRQPVGYDDGDGHSQRQRHPRCQPDTCGHSGL